MHNPLNAVLLVLVLYLTHSTFVPTAPKPLSLPLPTSPNRAYNWRPSLNSTDQAQVWRTWTPEQLRTYDGTGTADDSEQEGRILMAIRRKVYDVTTGRAFYGPGGPYAIFAGRDASRGLAKQSFEVDMLTPTDEPIDRLDDLTKSEWDNLRDWEGQLSGASAFKCKQNG